MPFFHIAPPLMLFFGGLSSIFWLVLLALLVWALVRWLAPRPAAPPFMTMHSAPANQPSAMEILRQRYARGEIDAETFDHMRERLEASQPQSQQAHP